MMKVFTFYFKIFSNKVPATNNPKAFSMEHSLVSLCPTMTEIASLSSLSNNVMIIIVMIDTEDKVECI